jgi:uncharacterized protein YktB (UPF0637 family)
MTPEEFLNKDFSKMKIELNPGRLETTKVKLAIENKWYSLAIMKNQIRILEFLQNGTITEDKIEELYNKKLKALDEHIQQEISDKFAFISSKTN